jgi:hypothetical protein
MGWDLQRRHALLSDVHLTLWTSPTIADWVALIMVVLKPQNALPLLGLYAAVALFFIALNWIYQRYVFTGKWRLETNSLRAGFAYTGVTLILLLAGSPRVYRTLGGQAESFLADLTTPRLNEADANLLLRGYYENLISVNRFNSELWELYSKRPTDWPLLQETSAARMTDDFGMIELNPNVDMLFHGASFSTNQWGFRDQEYTLEPAPGTLRTIIIGPSFVMGSGAADGEVFEAVLENRLNTEYGGEAYERYEILNFGVAGYSVAGAVRVRPDR